MIACFLYAVQNGMLSVLITITTWNIEEYKNSPVFNFKRVNKILIEEVSVSAINVLIFGTATNFILRHVNLNWFKTTVKIYTFFVLKLPSTGILNLNM